MNMMRLPRVCCAHHSSSRHSAAEQPRSGEIVGCVAKFFKIHTERSCENNVQPPHVTCTCMCMLHRVKAL